MQKLANRDKEILNEVIDNAKFIIDTKSSSKSDKEKATLFLEFSEKYKNRNRVIKSEMTYIKQYIAVYRMTKEMQKKQESQKEKAKSDIGKKRKMLNASKFSIGGLFYANLNEKIKGDISKKAYDEKICNEALMFEITKLSGFDEFIKTSWTDKIGIFKNSQNSFCIAVTIPQPQNEKRNNYVFINFYEKYKYTMYYLSYDYENLDEKGNPKQTNHKTYPVPKQIAHFILTAYAKMGIIEYEPLTGEIKVK